MRTLMRSLFHLRRFLRDESGQSTTEYILVLGVAVAVAVTFIKKFMEIAGGPLLESIQDLIEGRLSSGVYRVNLGRGGG